MKTRPRAKIIAHTLIVFHVVLLSTEDSMFLNSWNSLSVISHPFLNPSQIYSKNGKWQNIRPSIRPSRQNFTPKPQLSHHFPCAKKNLCVSLQRFRNDGSPFRQSSGHCSAQIAWAFFMPIIEHTWRLPFREILICSSG